MVNYYYLYCKSSSGCQNINVATGDDNIILGFIQCLLKKRVSCWSLVKYRSWYRIDSSQLFQMIFEIIRWLLSIFYHRLEYNIEYILPPIRVYSTFNEESKAPLNWALNRAKLNNPSTWVAFKKPTLMLGFARIKYTLRQNSPDSFRVEEWTFIILQNSTDMCSMGYKNIRWVKNK